MPVFSISHIRAFVVNNICDIPPISWDILYIILIPVFYVKAPSSKLKIKRVEMYFTNDGDVKKRVWTKVTPESDGNGIWSIQTPVSDLDKPLFAFANFIYEVEPIQVAVRLYNGKTEMCVTSEYAFAWPEELQAAAVKVTAK